MHRIKTHWLENKEKMEPPTVLCLVGMWPRLLGCHREVPWAQPHPPHQPALCL